MHASSKCTHAYAYAYTHKQHRALATFSQKNPKKPRHPSTLRRVPLTTTTSALVKTARKTTTKTIPSLEILKFRSPVRGTRLTIPSLVRRRSRSDLTGVVIALTVVSLVQARLALSLVIKARLASRLVTRQLQDRLVLRNWTTQVSLVRARLVARNSMLKLMKAWW